jgi:hypothetical protein
MHWKNCGSVPSRSRYISLCHHIQTSSRAHPAFSPVGTRRCVYTYKVVRVGSWTYASCSLNVRRLYEGLESHLSGVVFGVLATGPKGRGFKPSRGDGFLRAIKICSTPSFRCEVKPDVPCRKILWHIKDPLIYQRYWMREILIPSSIPHIHSLQMSLLGGLPESSGWWVRHYPQLASSSLRLSIHIHPGGWTTGQWWGWDISLNPIISCQSRFRCGALPSLFHTSSWCRHKDGFAWYVCTHTY